MTDKRLFISHANEDVEVVNRIVAYLEAHGVPCWVASRDIPPRAIYAEEITKGIEECEACAVVVSAAANKSKAVKRELELASHNDKPFIPIRIDGTDPGRGLDYYLRNIQWIDYSGQREAGLDRIVRHIRGGPTPVASEARPEPRVAAVDDSEGGGFAALTTILPLIVLFAILGWALMQSPQLASPPAPATDALAPTYAAPADAEIPTAAEPPAQETP